MIDFDLTSDGRFEASLHGFSTDDELDVLMALEEVIAQHLTWDDFVAEHGWEPVILGQYYQVVASTINQIVVICTLVRRFAPGP